MLHINRVTLLGHAGRDPDLRTLPDGGRAATFSLATTERWKRDGGEAAERTVWHRIVVYGAATDPVEAMVRKGAAVLVEGRLAHRRFTDREGRDREIAEIVVAGPQGMVNVLSRKPPEGPDPAEPPAAEPAKTESPQAVGVGPEKSGADDGEDTRAADSWPAGAAPPAAASARESV